MERKMVTSRVEGLGHVKEHVEISMVWILYLKSLNSGCEGNSSEDRAVAGRLYGNFPQWGDCNIDLNIVQSLL